MVAIQAVHELANRVAAVSSGDGETFVIVIGVIIDAGDGINFIFVIFDIGSTGAFVRLHVTIPCQLEQTNPEKSLRYMNENAKDQRIK